MRKKLAITSLVIGTAVVGFYLAPSRKEIALMQLSDFHYNDALQYYYSLWEQGDRSVNVLTPLINLNMYYGDVDKAIELLKKFIEDNPNSVEAHKRLAELYKSSQRFENYCDELEIVQKLSPSTATLRELADTYDFLGEYAKEMNALARLVLSDGYEPHEDDYINLASFLRVSNQPQEAIKAILRLISLKKYNVSIDAMLLAAQLLLETRDYERALFIAKKHLNRHGKESSAITLATVFHKNGQVDAAYDLLTPYLENLGHSPDLMQEVTTLLLAQGKDADAYNMLQGHYNKGKLPDIMKIPLIDLAVKYKNYVLAESLIHTLPLDVMPEDALLRYAALSFEAKKPEIAIFILGRLDKNYLEQNQLLSALLRVAAYDTAEAMSALLAVPPQNVPLPEQKIMVAGICIQHGFSECALKLIDGMPVSEVLKGLDTLQYAQLYLDAGAADKAEQILKNADRTGPSEIKPRIDKALFLLAVGKGNSEYVKKWVSGQPDIKDTFITDAYFLANRYKQYEAALMLARYMYTLDPNRKNRMQLAEALMLTQRYGEALNDLESLAGKDVSARSMYLEIMAYWIRKSGMEVVPQANRKYLESLVNSLWKSADISLSEKRNVAYLLEKTGARSKAESMLLALADSKHFADEDVSELLRFWGKSLTPEAIIWFKKRSNAADDIEKVKWLSHLNAIGYSQTVLEILSGATKFSPQINSEYIYALVAIHNSKLLDSSLRKEIDKEEDIGRLAKLATIAQQENLPKVAEKGWQKIYNIDPANAQAQKELGLLAFAAHHYTEAGGLLEKYLQNNKADYRVNYAYGEFLYRNSQKDEALSYFEAALKQVSEIKNKTLSTGMDEARLLYRNDKLEMSSALYRKLLARFPEDKALRADFAEFLIETKQFDEASSVLNRKK